ncbi:MAG: hypothetical protein WCS87_17860, partial [Methylococcaceae bacterium]
IHHEDTKFTKKNQSKIFVSIQSPLFEKEGLGEILLDKSPSALRVLRVFVVKCLYLMSIRPE